MVAEIACQQFVLFAEKAYRLVDLPAKRFNLHDDRQVQTLLRHFCQGDAA